MGRSKLDDMNLISPDTIVNEVDDGWIASDSSEPRNLGFSGVENAGPAFAGALSGLFPG